MNSYSVLSGKVSSVFFSFVIPAVLGMLAISSAGIIDGMFIGHYVGELALASANLSNPIYSFIYSFAILLSTGGEVFCGKFIGEGKFIRASDVFSVVVIIIFVISVIVSVFGLLFTDFIASSLGADNETETYMIDYLRIVVGATPLLTSYSLSYFVRVDGKPKLSSLSLILTSLLNIILDYIFIVIFDWGIKGAAWGTVLSYTAIPILLLPHFLFRRGKIIFKIPRISFKTLSKIIYNGSSEFFSEISGGILFFVINLTMLKYHGTQGVAAYAVVGYLLFFTVMISIAVSDALKSVVSINYGALKFKRVTNFLKVAIIYIVSFGLSLIVFSVINSDFFVGLFLKSSDDAVKLLSRHFVVRIAPIVPIMGINIVLSAYLAATHNSKLSLIISLLRTLLLPIILVPVISSFLHGDGVVVALIISEIVTFIVALFLLKRTTNCISSVGGTSL